MTVAELIKRLSEIKDAEHTPVIVLTQPSGYETLAGIEKTILISNAGLSLIFHAKQSDAVILVTGNLVDNAN